MEKKINISEITYIVSSDDNYLEAMGNNFEPHMVKLFCALIDPDDVVADIGANIGLTCLGPLKLCHYLLTKGVTENGTETVFG